MLLVIVVVGRLRLIKPKLLNVLNHLIGDEILDGIAHTECTTDLGGANVISDEFPNCQNIVPIFCEQIEFEHGLVGVFAVSLKDNDAELGQYGVDILFEPDTRSEKRAQ